MSIETGGLEALALQRSAMLKIVQTIESIPPSLAPAGRKVYSSFTSSGSLCV